ncbi:MAG: hypothetical protein M3O74_19925 [Pseudomonadota bacterium]|nr:hypothetical protein [Pseudomonadota bacterium]
MVGKFFLKPRFIKTVIPAQMSGPAYEISAKRPNGVYEGKYELSQQDIDRAWYAPKQVRRRFERG